MKEINRTYKSSKLQFESDMKQFRDADFEEKILSQPIANGKPAKTPSFALINGNQTDSDEINANPKLNTFNNN